MKKAIVFYCKDCKELFFACVKDSRVIKDSKKEIIQYLTEGHEMKEVNLEEVQIKLGACKCDERQLNIKMENK